MQLFCADGSGLGTGGLVAASSPGGGIHAPGPGEGPVAKGRPAHTQGPERRTRQATQMQVQQEWWPGIGPEGSAPGDQRVGLLMVWCREFQNWDTGSDFTEKWSVFTLKCH